MNEASVGEGDGVPWRSFFEEARQACQRAGLPAPDIDARRLVERAAGFEPSEFMLRLDEPATVRSVAHFDAMLARRVAGEPLQYVVGEWSFRTLDLMVDERALIPRPETEELVTHGLAELERQRSAGVDHLRAADLGTGTGAIGLSLLAECVHVEVLMTDASADALDLARANLAGLGRPARRATLRHGSWYDALEPRDRFHLLISNPPYVGSSEELPPVVAEWEPVDALFSGLDGLDDARVLIGGAAERLVPGGALVLELGATQLGAAAELAVAAGLVDVAVHQDLAGRDRALVARSAGAPDE